ncbi:conserved hypothetical protein [Sporisorium reilianum SRZ2]|uniref:Uncharacterized protein n=1 Tax=Sporisorium reilianum (strain SRZ2) TaxID=999809 RepID=E6ZZ40_SPORE|nr:conserved hypothetical protein [Sporisorium reilianum SRZ2]
MGIITFVTPPGRPSVLRANTIQEARAHHADAPSTQQPHASASALPHTNSESTPAQDADPQLIEHHQPLTFQKRILPQLTTSPEPAAENFDLPRSRKSLDEASSHRADSKRPSLLSTAMVASSANPPRSASTTNLGILRRAEPENTRSSLDGASRATGDVSDGTTSAPRPRLHFIEPHKQPVSNVSARPDAAVGNISTNDASAFTSKSAFAPTLAAMTAPAAAEAEPAPRKRSLVIQEHADVLERAAERAARQANHLSSQALEQHTRTSPSARSRQHSASSAGDETASTRSSWALRSSSRGSSIGTSPSVVSDDNAHEHPEHELVKTQEPPAIVPIFSNATANDRVDAARWQPAPANPPRKLTFISPAPSKRRRSPEVKPVSPGRRESDQDAASSSRNAGAVSDGDGQGPGDASRRVLAFAACPKPQRAARLSPAHATRKPKSKLSASPAPHKLAYPQRLRGIRGSDPIRSPAPDKPSVSTTQAAKWEQLLEHVSSEGSGYSEDEEDGDSDEEDDDNDDDDSALSGSSPSDNQSLSDSMLDKSEESASAGHDGGSTSSPDAVEELREEAVIGREQANRPSSRNAQLRQQTAPALLSDSEPGSSRHTSSRHSSGALPDHHSAGRTSFASHTSPPRPSHPSRSTQTSPLSGLANRSSRKLKPKDSLSHPMCFLPDAFEDSAPPTPTEPDSDAYESSHRANLLPGWRSEGGSAASSRRASWQLQPPAPASPRVHGEQEGLAVPISLPPFRRARERTAQHGVMSDGEQNSRSLGGNAAFIRESAGLGRGEEQRGVSPHAASGFQALGVSVPLQGRRPSQPMAWRHVSSQHVPVERDTALGYRRASHSMEPRNVPHASLSPRPVRPAAGKQRAVSTSSHIRCPPSVAASVHDDVVVATSPPRDDARGMLKYQLAHSPASGSTTPGWMSDGQLPSLASRYWSERLSSLAQAVSEELAIGAGWAREQDALVPQQHEGQRSTRSSAAEEGWTGERGAQDQAMDGDAPC